MSGFEKMDIMLGIFPENDFGRQVIAGELEAGPESDRLQKETLPNRRKLQIAIEHEY